MKLSWDNITVQQFQDIYRLSLNTSLDEMDKLERVICILYNKTEKEVEELSMQEFKECAKECSFVLTDKIPGKPVKYIKVGARKYGIQYAVHKLRHRQYVEILHFSEKPIENMHYIMASLVQPIKFGIWKKNEAEMHETISLDMLNAKVVDVYHTCVFFCKLYVNLIKNIQGSLVVEMMSKGMTKTQAETVLNASATVMDGFIQHTNSQAAFELP